LLLDVGATGSNVFLSSSVLVQQRSIRGIGRSSHNTFVDYGACRPLCSVSHNRLFTMAAVSTELDVQIERLRKGDTLPENQVKALCEKVSKPMACLLQA
jgi:hypothetical protein